VNHDGQVAGVGERENRVPPPYVAAGSAAGLFGRRAPAICHDMADQVI
jgi:hypothetical protein